jgi:structural maintenance of chromosomes protein 5
MVESDLSCRDLDRDFKQIKNLFNQKKQVYRELQEKAMEEAPLEEDGNETALRQKLEVDLAQYETVDLAEAALEEAEQKIRNTVADRNVARLHEAKKQELETAQDQLESLTKDKTNRLADMRHKAEPWEESLKKFIAKVDTRFSRYMSELGCVGEVRLRMGKEGADGDVEARYEDYGVEIRVSFREGVKPSVLSARVQSGGERSVSTIMYLMALQVSRLSVFTALSQLFSTKSANVVK